MTALDAAAVAAIARREVAAEDVARFIAALDSHGFVIRAKS